MKKIVSMPGMVRKQTRMKKLRYPRASWIKPLTIPGSIMPRAIRPVEMAKWEVLYGSFAMYMRKTEKAVNPRP